MLRTGESDAYQLMFGAVGHLVPQNLTELWIVATRPTRAHWEPVAPPAPTPESRTEG